MTVEIISWSISTKVWDRTVIELATPGSAVRQASVVRHVTDCATRPGIKGWVFLGWTSTKLGFMCLAQGHKAVMSVRLEPGPLGLESSTLPLSQCTPPFFWLRVFTFRTTIAHDYNESSRYLLWHWSQRSRSNLFNIFLTSCLNTNSFILFMEGVHIQHNDCLSCLYYKYIKSPKWHWSQRSRSYMFKTCPLLVRL